MQIRRLVAIGLAALLLFGGSAAVFGWGATHRDPDDAVGITLYGETTGVSGAAPTHVWSGYLVDKASGSAMKSGDIDLTMSPQELTRESEISNGGSGFGISVMQGSSYSFVPFDQKGNQIASQLVLSSTRDKGLSIIVSGKIVNDVLMVSSIKESNL